MAQRRKFIVGDLVQYEGKPVARALDALHDRAIGIIVDSLALHEGISFIYRLRWIEPYEVFGELVYEDEVYEKNLTLLSRATDV